MKSPKLDWMHNAFISLEADPEQQGLGLLDAMLGPGPESIPSVWLPLGIGYNGLRNLTVCKPHCSCSPCFLPRHPCLFILLMSHSVTGHPQSSSAVPTPSQFQVVSTQQRKQSPLPFTGVTFKVLGAISHKILIAHWEQSQPMVITWAEC